MKEESLTAAYVLGLVADRAQQCREDGDSDMRVILSFVNGLKRFVDRNASRGEVEEYFSED
jgi:hypothetical protein